MFMYGREIAARPETGVHSKGERARAPGVNGFRAMRVVFAVRSLAQEPGHAAGRGPVDGLAPLMLGREGQFCLQRLGGCRIFR